MNQQNPRIFPNPATGIINVIAPQGSYTMTVLDVLGNEIYKGYFSGNQQVDLSDVRKGLYVVKLEGDSFLTTEKLLLR